ncbi:MAG TPA: choice-of-anchor tandem repeat NxxGxxAF-containing protein [Phycisphaerales bacterium]|nr:choice-of-anchor tandem repeat NxxGxxAF-containing protein [Phycisphaerales bacterium]
MRLAPFGIALVSCGSLVHGQQVQVIAVSGQPAYGIAAPGVTVQDFFGANISANGTVSFGGFIRGRDPLRDESVVWARTAGDFTNRLIYDRGLVIGDATVTGVRLGFPRDDGSVLFSPELTLPDDSTTFGCYMRTSSGELVTIAHPGNTAPGTSLTATSARFMSVSSSTSAVAYSAFTNTTQFLLYADSTMPTTPYAVSSVPLAGLPTGGAMVSLLSGGDINRFGRTAVTIRATGYPSVRDVLWTNVGTVPQVIAAQFQPMPGIAGSISATRLPVVNDNGEVIFWAGATNGTWTLLRWQESSGFSNIMISGTAAVGIPGAVFKGSLTHDRISAISSPDGVVVFSTLVSGAGINSSNDRGLWVHSSAGTRLIVRTGEPAPDAPAGVTVSDLSRFAVTRDGRVAVVTLLSNGQSAVYREDATGQLKKVLMRGDVINVPGQGPRTVTSFEIAGSVVGVPESGQRFMSDDGAIVARVNFLDAATVRTTDTIVVFDATWCDSIDFNNNLVFPEDQDVIDFFDVLGGATCAGCNDIDFNNNGVFPEDQDVIDFFNVLAGGTCS